MKHYLHLSIMVGMLALISCQSPKAEQENLFEVTDQAIYQQEMESGLNDSILQARTEELEVKLVEVKKRLEKSWEDTGNRDSARNAFREKIYQEFDEFFFDELGLDFDSTSQAEGWNMLKEPSR